MLEGGDDASRFVGTEWLFRSTGLYGFLSPAKPNFKQREKSRSILLSDLLMRQIVARSGDSVNHLFTIRPSNLYCMYHNVIGPPWMFQKICYKSMNSQLQQKYSFHINNKLASYLPSWFSLRVQVLSPLRKLLLNFWSPQDTHRGIWCGTDSPSSADYFKAWTTTAAKVISKALLIHSTPHWSKDYL